MRYLVTGGAGFIGSHLSTALLDRDDEVIVLDDLSTGSLDNIRPELDRSAFLFREGSVLDAKLVGSLVKRSDVIVHLAAAVGVKLIIDQPLQSLITNIRGAEVVLEACARTGAKVLVTSTSEIYGKNADGPLDEDADRVMGSPYKARWSYSSAKVVDEILAHAYWRERGLPTIVARLFNTVGARQTGAYGMVVPRLVEQALLGQDVTVYGDGQQRRSFCDVRDTVAGLLGLLDHPDAPGRPFNIGRTEEVSINRLARRIVKMTGSPSRIVHIPYDVAYEEGFEDMQRRIPDTSRLTALTGWRPKHTLDEVLADVIADRRVKLRVPVERGVGIAIA